RVIGVASYDNTHVNGLPFFTVSPDDLGIGYQNAVAAPPAPTSGSFPLVRTGSQTSADDACAALPTGSLAGAVVLIRRGGCTFNQKANNAQIAGAAGVVLYNNALGRFGATVEGGPTINIPVVTIDFTEGNLLDSPLAAGPVTMTWTSQTGTFVNSSGNLISAFSSYGLAADLSMKPDLGAPGGLIRSTYPLERGGSAILSGTSMSSPHVAGSAALLLESNPFLKPEEVQTRLLNSADPQLWSLSPGLGFLDHVHRQGAGMVDVDDAILATTIVTPAQLPMGESEAGPRTHHLTIRNFGWKPVTYNLSYENALSTSGTIAITGF